MLSHNKHPSVLAGLLGWCRGRQARPQSVASVPGAADRAPVAPAAEPEPADLLFRCMDKLQIDHDVLAKEDPLLLRALQRACTSCRNRDECGRELTHEFDDARWDRWRAYCPNSSTLSTIGARQNCARAAQQLKAPRAIALPGRR